MGVLALDSKGDLSEPLLAIALHLGRESDVRQLEVRPDDALPDWQPRYAMNIFKRPLDIRVGVSHHWMQSFFVA